MLSRDVVDSECNILFIAMKYACEGKNPGPRNYKLRPCGPSTPWRYPSPKFSEKFGYREGENFEIKNS